MSLGSVVERHFAKRKTTRKFHFEIGLDIVGEVETVFSSHHQIVGSVGEEETTMSLRLSHQYYTASNIMFHVFTSSGIYCYK